MMPAKQSGRVEDPLSRYLVKLLNFEAGRGFFEPNTTGCHWSELIHYLLRVTFSLPLRTRDIRPDPDMQRGRDISFFNRMGFMSGAAAPPSAYVPGDRANELTQSDQGHPPDDRQREYAEGGMGRVIVIETWEVRD